MAITKIKTTTKEMWLAERAKSLGGSDIGAVLGLSEYSSPYTVWAEKTNRLPPKAENEWTRLGNDLEGYVAQRFTEKSGLKVINDQSTWRNSKYPYLHANIDRKIVGMRAGLECKLTSELNAQKYRNGEFPDRFYAQCVEYLCVSEFDRWYLAVLVYGKGLFIYQLTRIPNDMVPEWCESSVYVEDGEIEALAQAADDFWTSHVLKDVPPQTDGKNSTSESIGLLFPKSNDEIVGLTAYNRDLAEYIALSAQIKALEGRKEDVANRVKAFMKEAGKGESERYRVSWTSAERSNFDAKRFAADHRDIDLSEYYKKSTYRTFKVTEIGG